MPPPTSSRMRRVDWLALAVGVVAAAPRASVQDLTWTYRTSWNPFAPGPLVVEFDVHNTGPTRRPADLQVCQRGDADASFVASC